MSLDPRTPVLVGVAAVMQRCEDPTQAAHALDLMVRAVEEAAADAGALELLIEADAIAIPRGLWDYADPARFVADRVGAKRARSIVAQVGVLQQSLLTDACRRIAEGEAEVTIVAGGEAKYRSLRAQIGGIELPDAAPQSTTPDEVLEPRDLILDDIEMSAGLASPVQFYAILENALRHSEGQGVEAHRDAVAEIWARFSEVARDNPHAWRREPIAAETIRDPAPKNAMLAFPYTKLHNSQWNVDQAGALIFCSVERAEALGIPREKWVFPQSATESNFMSLVSARDELQSSPGCRIAGRRALELAGVTAADLDFIELYSCFPAAVRIQAREIGIDPERALTVTGGMTFAGGPLNNWVVQAMVAMAKQLRAVPGSKGLVTSISGFITKQGNGVWSTDPPAEGFRFEDVSSEVERESPLRERVAVASGPAVIAGYTVGLMSPELLRALVIADLPDGRRTVVKSDDSEVAKEMMRSEFTGRSIEIVDGGDFRLV